MTTLTVEDASAILAAEMEWAKAERSKYPFDSTQETRFKHRVLLIGPGGSRQIAALPLKWTERDEMRLAMNKAAFIAKALSAQAIAVVIDATFAKMDRVMKHFGKRPPESNEPAEIQRVMEEYRKLFHGPMKGAMANLPKHLYDSAIVAAVKGPAIGTFGTTAVYIEERGRVLFEDKPKTYEMGEHKLIMVPDWWTIPDDDPTLQEVRKMVEDELSRMVTSHDGRT